MGTRQGGRIGRSVIPLRTTAEDIPFINAARRALGGRFHLQLVQAELERPPSRGALAAVEPVPPPPKQPAPPAGRPPWRPVAQRSTAPLSDAAHRPATAGPAARPRLRSFEEAQLVARMHDDACARSAARRGQLREQYQHRPKAPRREPLSAPGVARLCKSPRGGGKVFDAHSGRRKREWSAHGAVQRPLPRCASPRNAYTAARSLPFSSARDCARPLSNGWTMGSFERMIAVCSGHEVDEIIANAEKAEAKKSTSKSERATAACLELLHRVVNPLRDQVNKPAAPAVSVMDAGAFTSPRAGVRRAKDAQDSARADPGLVFGPVADIPGKPTAAFPWPTSPMAQHRAVPEAGPRPVTPGAAPEQQPQASAGEMPPSPGVPLMKLPATLPGPSIAQRRGSSMPGAIGLPTSPSHGPSPGLTSPGRAVLSPGSGMRSPGRRWGSPEPADFELVLWL
eukprot:TRINITY_DN65894_c0_g1_i1.p1 TRINITY_DN65894_c0_g1~~TRINITY_DN65894_c0_g1_i1.p1  ORF type:complete len:486 (+),score=92.71 TRINITY_DN65894_c0_g1_i1:99-1460(+)